MVGSQSGGDPAHIAGDGDYAIEVVSESRHQDVLEWIVQGRGEEPADHVCMALLALERGDSGTSPVVSVSIRGVQIGHLPPEAADGLIESMQIWGFARATCEAVIEGGWYRSAEDKGDFSVWLDAHPDFTPVADPGAVDLAPALPVAIAVPNANARKTGRDLVFGALATFALMGVIGIVWLVVDQRNEPMFGNRVAVSSSAPISAQRADPSFRLAEAAGGAALLADARDNRGTVAALDQPAPAPVLSGSRNRPLGAVAIALMEAPAMPSAPFSVIQPATDGAARSGRVPETPAAAGRAVLGEHNMTPVTVLAPVAAQEIRSLPGHRKPFVAAAAPLAKPIAPRPAAVLSSVMLTPPPQAAPKPETRAAEPPPAPPRAARHSRPQAKPRANVRSRNASRSSRRGRRPVQYQRPQRAPAQYQRAPGVVVFAPAPTAAPNPPRPPAAFAGSPLTPAARMFEAWAREWSAAAQKGLGPPRPRAR